MLGELFCYSEGNNRMQLVWISPPGCNASWEVPESPFLPNTSVPSAIRSIRTESYVVVHPRKSVGSFSQVQKIAKAPVLQNLDRLNERAKPEGNDAYAERGNTRRTEIPGDRKHAERGKERKSGS